MNKYKRIVTLILALLMMSGIFFGAFAAIASAAVLQVNTIYTTDTIVVSGTPEPAQFGKEGKYEFTKIDIATTPATATVTFGPNVKDKEPITVSADKKAITYGGLTITKKDDTVWSEPTHESDNFTIALEVKQTVNPDAKDPIITYSKTVAYQTFNPGGSDPNDNARGFSSMHEITRNKQVNILLTISDPNGGVIDNNSVYIIPESGAFRSISTSEVRDDPNHATRFKSRVKNLSNGKQALEIDLIRLEYTGKGNSLSFTYGYTLDAGTPDARAVEYHASVTIPECVEYTRRPEDPEKDPDPMAPIIPHIIVSQYSFGGLTVTAGQQFSLDLSITNTSPTYDIENVVMTIKAPEGMSLTNSSNTYYFPRLDKKKSISQSITMQALPSAKPQAHNIDISFKFQYIANEKRVDGPADAEVIAIPVTQIDRFSVNPIEAPSYLYVGDEYPISAVCVNKGRSEVYNVSAEIRGNIPNPGQKQFIGNIESGKENSADFFITGQEAGPLNGEVVVTYEDANMNIKEIIMPFEVMVQAMDFGPPPDIDIGGMLPPPVEPVDTKPDSRTISLGFAGLIIAALTAFVNVKKVKAKRIGEDDEDI